MLTIIMLMISLDWERYITDVCIVPARAWKERVGMREEKSCHLKCKNGGIISCFTSLVQSET